MFIFKGISSEEMQVVIEEEEHFIARAARRYEKTEIEGKDGAIYDELGYSDVERPILVQCLNISKIDDILEWLDGEGEFEYKGRKTTARFYAEADPERKACIRIIDTTFIRDPFWYKADEEYVTVTDIIENEGNIVSRPIIRLEKSEDDEVDITINDIRFKYTFDTDTYVEIDCEKGAVTYQGLNRSRQITMGYEFPRLKKGNNQIIMHEGDCVIKVLRKDRWL